VALGLAEKIIIADDHPLFRGALREAVLKACPDATIIEAENFAELQATTEEHPDADLLLLDLNMPGASGFSSLIYVRSKHESLPTVVISALEETWVIRRAIAHGAAGFVPKSSPVGVISQALQVVLEGDCWLPPGIDADHATLEPEEQTVAHRLAQLTPQQFRVFSMLSEGLLNKQIAFELGVSEATVKAHVTAIMKKLGVTNRTQAVLEANHLALERKLTSGTA
jgi:DNA-binding NarL/FixJ family response regulator